MSGPVVYGGVVLLPVTPVGSDPTKVCMLSESSKTDFQEAGSGPGLLRSALTFSCSFFLQSGRSLVDSTKTRDRESPMQRPRARNRPRQAGRSSKQQRQKQARMRWSQMVVERLSA